MRKVRVEWEVFKLSEVTRGVGIHMTYQEEKLTRLKRQRSKQAIELAMQGRWREAIAANEVIIENFPNDVDSYNRLGRAYMELGEYNRAKEAYRKALEIDQYNTIAQKNLQRLNYLSKAAPVNLEGGYRKVEPHKFIEEIGKAGVVNLESLAPQEIRAKMIAGDRVTLRVENHNLIVENAYGEYLGKVEPKHAQRLVKLIEGGNQYAASVVSSTEEGMTVIIRETYQHPNLAGKQSFPTKGLEEVKPYVEERVFRMESELADELAGEPGYTIIGGQESDFLAEEAEDFGDDMENEED